MPESERWRPIRAGIQNLWEYDDQRFVFHRGRLVLRGRNESGKSKALELLFPFLLDADLSPERLDPFGSKARQMRWNLLGDGASEGTTAVGFVWIEFGRLEGADARWCTIGARLRAKTTTRDVEVAWFATDQRVDVDLHLVGAERIPVSRAHLADALGTRGQVFASRSEYQAEINRTLFGMPDDQYAALVTALIELRRPQLSKQLQPAELSRILSVSLPPLDAEVVGRVAEGFERLERHRIERDRLAGTHKALGSFLDVYRRYVQAVARDRAQAVVRAEAAYHASRARQKEADDAASDALRKQADAAVRQGQQEARQVELDGTIAALKESPAWRDAAQLHALQRVAESTAAEAAGARRRSDEAAAEVDRLARRVREEHDRLDAASRRREDAAGRAERAAVGAQLEDEHRALAIEDTGAARGLLAGIERQRGQHLGELRQLGQAVRHAESEVRRATERLQDGEAQERRAREDLDAAASAVRESESQFVDAVDRWAAAATSLGLAPEELAEFAAATPDDAGALAQRAVEMRRGRVDAELVAVATTRRQVDARRADVQRERDALAAATHAPPRAPDWRGDRTDRPGAPLYLLCEFDGALAPGVQANVEAALQASGLLDAWVMPDGQVLGLDVFDVALTPVASEGPTLAQALRPTPTAGVPESTISRVLASIAFGGDSPPEGRAWVGADGSWRLGPLAGALRKARVEYVGETARDLLRRRRLTELDRDIEKLRTELEQLDEATRGLKRRRKALDEELRSFPSLEPLRRARANLMVRATNLERAEREVAERRQAVTTASDRLAAAAGRRDARARELRLLAWVDSLDELGERTRDYVASARALLAEGDAVREARRVVGDVEESARRAASLLARAREEQTDADGRAEAASVQLRTLRAALGDDPDAVLRKVEEAERTRGRVARELKDVAQAVVDTAAEATLLGERRRRAGEDVAAREAERGDAATHLRLFARSSLLSVLAVPSDSDPDAWTWTQILSLARGLEAQLGAVDASQEARERAENNVTTRHRDLGQELPPDLQLRPLRTDGLLVYEGVYSGRALGMPALREALAQDVATRDRLLNEQEMKLLESFLSGEIHEHLRARLRCAHELIEAMNRELSKQQTAGGTRIRLAWTVTEDAPVGADLAIDLLLHASELLTEDKRKALGAFIQQRLQMAREEEAAGTLLERLLVALDYRRWHQFAVKFKPDGASDYRLLTTKAHSAGSGGQKAVMLHLPLFAAASAFYASAHRHAPRVIALDEAFAGIDRDTRGDLMGLLVKFDLDFIMTSYDEWGFYEQVDGLAAYHLARERGVRGVYTDRFVWDGGELFELGAG